MPRGYDPLLGGVLVRAGSLRLLFVVLAALGAAVAGRASLRVPVVPSLPRIRQTVLGLARRPADPTFLAPTAALAAATAALSVGIGSCPSPAGAPGSAPLPPALRCRCSPPVRPRSSRRPGGPWTTDGGRSPGASPPRAWAL
ncbi:hypothetical protein [Streptomyces hokutonensis]|uniref:hypothetical protein n=1 Tax=Streptomyces hokutonensis TaxID=1306990 RepID=UPI0036916693